jgi:iron(III)-enterobactin esterase
MPNESMDEEFVRSESRSPGRRIWRLGSSRGVPAGLLLFLDAELYLERVSAAEVVTRLEKEGRIPPVLSVFVSNNGSAARHADYVCDADYARFLVEELLPFVKVRNPEAVSDGVVLVGLSLSGLAAAHAALATDRFKAVVCQSPSFWWDGERFASSLPSAGGRAPAFWVSVGDLETESGISHPPSGLFQGTSQRESCDRGSAALRAAGYMVAHRVFQGGHDPVCWREDLALALPWATSA